MKLVYLLGIVVLLVSGFAAAQDASEYRLHPPTAAEYLDAIPAIMAAAEANPDQAVAQNVTEAMRTEISQRFDEAELLQLGSRKLTETMNLIDGWFPGLGMGVRAWSRMIVQSYLDETSLDLDNVDTFAINDDLTVYVTPRDFDADGEPEYLLRVILWYDIYLLASRSSDAYRVSIVPLWASPMLHYEEIGFEDYNHDGYPEWILKSLDDAGLGFCGTLRILNWHDDAFTEMISGGATYCSPNWGRDATLKIVDTNDDGVADFAFEMSVTDIWQCLATDTAEFASAGSRWIAYDQDHLANSFACHVREAEEAMWNHHYDAAVDAYRTALRAGGDDPERVQYAQARLAIALALTGDLDGARAALVNTSRSGQMGELLAALDPALQGQNDSFAVCAAAYQFIAETNTATPVDRYPFGFYIGLYALDGFVPRMLEDFPSPTRAGCDVQPMLAEHLAALDFPSKSLPADLLAASGLDVRQALPGDFDGDGAEEWLVWLDLLVAPVYFDAADGQWQMTSADVLSRTNLENNYEFATITLPESQQAALVVIHWLPPDSPAFERRNMTRCPNFENTTAGQLIVYQHDSEDWSRVGDTIPLCAPIQLSELFPAAAQNHEIHAWQYAEAQIVPTIYFWDVEQRFYLAEGEHPFGETPSLSVEWALSDLSSAIQRNDYEKALLRADDAMQEISDFSSSTSDQVDAIRYFRALMLDLLDRPDEALSEYLAIVELDPDSPWALLAALHLEPIDGNSE